MTEQTQPTDAELIDFATEEQFLLFCDPDEFVDIARAIFAKWGTPAGAGEVPGPVRLRFFRDMTEEQRLLVFKVFGVLPEEAESQADTHHVQSLLLKAMYRQIATQQPTQEQAGAVPLTDEQSHALLERMADEADKWGESLSYEPTREQVAGWCVAFLMRELPTSGIKGADHG